MAKQSTKPATPAATPATPANPMAALAATLVANPPAAPAAKVLVTTLGAVTYKTANHNNVLKSTATACPAGFATTSYKLGKVAYNPVGGTFTVMQWAAYQQAITANGGTATGAQIWAAAVALGFNTTQLATLKGFGPYRAKPGNLILAS